MTVFAKSGCRMIPKDFGIVSTKRGETIDNYKSAIIMMAFIYTRISNASGDGE